MAKRLGCRNSGARLLGKQRIKICTFFFSINDCPAGFGSYVWIWLRYKAKCFTILWVHRLPTLREHSFFHVMFLLAFFSSTVLRCWEQKKIRMSLTASSTYDPNVDGYLRSEYKQKEGEGGERRGARGDTKTIWEDLKSNLPSNFSF